MANDDMELVRAYAVWQSEPAFETLVARYINLVYSTALRQAGDPHLAEEITQAVFILLTRKAGTLGPRTILPSWLHRAAGFVAADGLKKRRRLARREQEAHMQSLLNQLEPEVWPQIAPLLDAAIAGLGEKDRHAIVLRFFQDKSLGEIGAAIGVSQEAAKKRVNRALEKLQKYFSKRGVDSTTAVIAGAISANSVQAAPAALAKSVAIAALAKGAAASTSTLTLIQGVLKIMAWTKAKAAVVAGVAALLVVGSTATVVLRAHPAKIRPIPSGQTEFPKDSWAFAGYGDAPSALMSYMWASVCQSNRKIFEDSLTPAQKTAYHQIVRMNMKVPQAHSEADEVARTFKRAADTWQGGSYQIIEQEAASADQVIFQVKAQMPGRQVERRLRMAKMGNEWKFDGFISSKH